MKIRSRSRSKISNSSLNQEFLQIIIPGAYDKPALMNCHEKENLVLPEFLQGPSKAPKALPNQQFLKENIQRTRKSSNILPESIIYHKKNPSTHLARALSISEMLQQLRQKSKQKISSNHPQPMKRKKTVSFGNYIEMSSPGTKYDSENLFKTKNEINSLLESSPQSSHIFHSNIDQKKYISPNTPPTEKLISYSIPIQKQDKIEIFNNNEHLPMKNERISDTSVSTQQNADITNFSHIGIGNCVRFQYEGNDDDNILYRKNKEFDKTSNIAYCKNCQKLLKTDDFFESYQKKGCEEITEWILSWIMPGCMQKDQIVIGKCSFCNSDIYKTQ